VTLITINPGAGIEVPPGVYPVTLVEISGPRVIVPQSGPNAGQEVEILDWQFAIDEGDLDGTQIDATSSTSSGPRSKLYAWITALTGQQPAVGQQFTPEDLKGRRAYATIVMNDQGWPRVEALTAIPVTQRATRAPAAAQAAPATQRRPQAAASGQRTSVGQAPGLRQRVGVTPAPAAGEEIPF
jgi:hypothetical protein